MRASAPDHPAPDELRSLLDGSGDLDPTRRDAVEAHVMDCEECSERLDELEQSPRHQQDALLERARDARNGSEWLASARQAAIDSSEESSDSDESSDDDAEWQQSVRLKLADHPRYDIREELESGGMGVVFRARHRMMRRNVVIKVVNRRLTLNKAAAARFRRETRAAARLSHPSIVTAYDSEVYRGLHFLVMELVQGTTLTSLIENSGPLELEVACDYTRQIAEGLQHAFERGMIHRDIKPQNLMRSADGTVKILDFGLARLSAIPPKHPATMQVIPATQVMGVTRLISVIRLTLSISTTRPAVSISERRACRTTWSVPKACRVKNSHGMRRFLAHRATPLRNRSVALPRPTSARTFTDSEPFCTSC